MPAPQGLIERYRPYLSLAPDCPPVTLLEGNTPLVPVPSLADELGAAQVWVKFEGLNPTGSFKDRGMTVAVSEAAARGAATAICASTGNTAASAAAYAARAGMRCLVVVPQGKVALGKLAGALAYGAQVVQLQGSFDQALDLVRQICQRHPVALLNSLNPFRLEGQKTLAFELCEQLEGAPHWVALPVGNAGNITALWMGFRQFNQRHGGGLPHLLGVQAAGAAPLVLGHPVEEPETVATAIRIGRPARGPQALEAAAQSGGRIVAVPDEAILAAQRRLAAEGLWVEPASAAGLAGLQQEVSGGKLRLEGQRVVIVCTGHGLKDPDIVLQGAPPARTLPASLEALEEEIGLS